jgi:glycosyltransferase involved in cell wall biosynthesis
MVAPPWFEVPPQGYGGAEVIIAALTDALVDLGHEVTLFGTGPRTGTRARFVPTRAELQYPRLNELYPAVLHTAEVNRLLAQGGFDVVHDHTTDGPLTAPSRKVPTVMTVHNTPGGEMGDYLAALGDTVGLVAISGSQRALRPDLNWVATVHNAVPPQEVPGGRRKADGSVVWLARFSADKGPDLAVDACRAAGLPLVLAGKCTERGEVRYLEDTIRPMLDETVDLLINCDRMCTQQVLAEARCLIMPIRWPEPFGMVIIEAMALGVPVVALRRGAVPELIRHEVTGFICDEPEELPGCLLRAGEIDPEACMAHVRDNFGAALMARRYERVYREAMARRQPTLNTRLVEVRRQQLPVHRAIGRSRWAPS